MIKKWLRDYFTFNQVEVRGIRVLLALVVFTAIIYALMPVLFPAKHSPPPSPEFRNKVNAFLLATDSMTDSLQRNTQKSFRHSYPTSTASNKNIQAFNPNNQPAETWIKLGLSPKQADVIKRYEAKGGRFRKPEDLKKLYVISQEFYNRIEPYLLWDTDTTYYAANTTSTSEKINKTTIRINSATQAEWEQIQGIGEKLALRILKYRDALGGFNRITQLKEVYGLSPETYDNMVAVCIMDEVPLKKIPINTADFKQLNDHPYIDYELAGKIIDYRKKYGPFKDEAGFKKSGLADADLSAKLVPYLSFQ